MSSQTIVVETGVDLGVLYRMFNLVAVDGLGLREIPPLSWYVGSVLGYTKPEAFRYRSSVLRNYSSLCLGFGGAKPKQPDGGGNASLRVAERIVGYMLFWLGYLTDNSS